MKNYWYCFWNFLKYPGYSQKENLDYKEITRGLLYYLFFSYLIEFIGVIFVMLIATFSKLYTSFNLLSLMHDNRIDTNTGDEAIFVSLLVPVIEEITCRGYLNLKRNYFLTSIGVLLGIVYSFTYPIDDNQWYVFRLAINLLIPVSVIFLLSPFIETYLLKLLTFLKNNYRVVYYFSVTFFALGHLFNFSPLTWQHILFAPILVLPQFISGLFLGYVRIRYNLFSSILLHSMMNGLLIILNLLKG